MMENPVVNPQVLYELTLRCNKNCKYCGSKQFLNKGKEKSIDKVKIAQEIVSVNPREVTITGGQPSVDNKLLDVLSVFQSKKVKCKILTNGNLFTLPNFQEVKEKVYWIGYSVNTQEDIKFCKEKFAVIPFDSTTMVTNFGSHNLKDFQKLAKIATLFSCWQVQLTMGNELQLDLSEIRDLYKKLDDLEKTGFVKVVRADNLVCGQCKSGIAGFSVCYNGDVVPCLSYRSWRKDMDVQGNVLTESLKDIWKNKFEFYRNRQFFPCCKDITGVNRIDTQNGIENIKKILLPPDDDSGKKGSGKKGGGNRIFVYGVYSPSPYDTPLVYGVWDDDLIQ